MSGTSVDVKLDLLEIEDAFTEEMCDNCGDALGWGDEYAKSCRPTLYRFDWDGESWISDRRFMFPEPALAELDRFNVEALPEKSVPTAQQWLESASRAKLIPSTRLFGAPFAVAFTRAGLAAFDPAVPILNVRATDLAVLCSADGKRVGVMMPLNPSNPASGGRGCSIPAPTSVVTAFNTLRESGAYTILGFARSAEAALVLAAGVGVNPQ